MTAITENEAWEYLDQMHAEYLAEFAQIGEITTHEWAMRYYKKAGKRELDLAATELNLRCEAEPPTMTSRLGRNKSGRPCKLYKRV